MTSKLEQAAVLLPLLNGSNKLAMPCHACQPPEHHSSSATGSTGSTGAPPEQKTNMVYALYSNGVCSNKSQGAFRESNAEGEPRPFHKGQARPAPAPQLPLQAGSANGSAPDTSRAACIASPPISRQPDNISTKREDLRPNQTQTAKQLTHQFTESHRSISIGTASMPRQG